MEHRRAVRVENNSLRQKNAQQKLHHHIRHWSILGMHLLISAGQHPCHAPDATRMESTPELITQWLLVCQVVPCTVAQSIMGIIHHRPFHTTANSAPNHRRRSKSQENREIYMQWVPKGFTVEKCVWASYISTHKAY